MQIILFVGSCIAALSKPCYACSTDEHKYIAPSATDSRSPCPGLNALANQGYIPRNGRNISPAQLADAMIEVMNLEIEAFDSEIQVTLNHSTMGNNSTFNLVDSNVHNSIEIDGSLSRNDLYFGETIYFNETIWNQTASKFYGDIITIPIAAESHAYRVAKDAATNPDFTPNEFISGLAPAIYMLVFGGRNATQVRRDWIESFFRDRLPTHLGWTKSPVRLTKDDIFAMSSTISAATAATKSPVANVN